MDTYDTYKEKLAGELAEVTVALEEIGARDPNVPEDWVATPDEAATSEADADLVADRNEEWSERQGELDVLETRYNNLRRALKKIEGGTYGICEVCGKEIETARLDANPAARTCIEHRDETNLPN